MRFLVTGGAGFIGSHIVEELLGRKHQVRVLDNFSTGKRENLDFAANSCDLAVVDGDIRDRETVARAVDGIQGVFHEAALVSVPATVEQPRLSLEINALGSFNVFEAARHAGVRRVVYASSAAVYGDSTQLPLAESVPPRPLSPYGLDKLYTEYLGALYQSLYGLETLALRYFNVFGPRQDPGSPYSGVISIFVDLLRAHRTPTIFGDGDQTRDFVYVGDVVEANLRAMLADYRGFRVFNVATGRQTSLNQLLSQLQQLTGTSVVSRFAEARKGDIRHSLADISLIARELGYVPSRSLSQGLSLLVDSVR
jgi:UDP-N-acetylglucosamine/UDP-N-acetyl-alpha-D-glucosaminouronate 4-epimerase